jgi:uncharacterized membrane protein
MESEFDTSLIIENSLKQKIENFLKNEIYEKMLSESDLIRHVPELVEISKKLKLEDKDFLNFACTFLERDTEIIKFEKKLKIIYFNINAELERMEEIKNRIDKKSENKAAFFLFVLLLILIFQTGLFYHLIFNVEFLGLDLIEPITFFFSSIVFILGLFSYVKLNKNSMSGERLFQQFRNEALRRRYIKQNFHLEKYNELKYNLELVTNTLEKTKNL